ncbi:hypothetical protein [Nonomuraea sp. NPDC050643]|uniref:hypothetical protein n=1 Tax=Nonomuraea sp. NPDC050643 TaxID=3155660 RepID=UPI0033CCE6C4
MAGSGVGRPGSGQGGGRRRAAGKGVVVPIAVGVSCVAVVSLTGGAVWYATKPDPRTSVSLNAASPSPSPSRTAKPPATTKPKKTTRPKTTEPTVKPTKTTTKTTPKSTPTPDRTTARPTPAPVKTTKKPVVNARASILEIEMFGGPGQNDADGCYMPPVHFQTYVESTKREIWITSQWVLDGKGMGQRKSWVSEDVYTAFVTSGQYDLKAGRHTVALKVSSPSVTQKSLSFNVCALPTW